MHACTVICSSRCAAHTASGLDVSVERLPSDQLVSGGRGVMLLCTIKASGVVGVQWYNGTSQLVHSDSIVISPPYQLHNSSIWLSTVELAVLHSHTAWYYCEVTDSGDTDSIQLNIADIGMLRDSRPH